MISRKGCKSLLWCLFLKAEYTGALPKRQNSWSRWASEVAYLLNLLKSKLIFFPMKFWSLLWCINTIIMEANQVFKTIWFCNIFDSTNKFISPIVRLQNPTGSACFELVNSPLSSAEFRPNTTQLRANATKVKLNKTEWTENLTWKATTRLTFYMAIIIKDKKIRIVNTA